MLIIALVHRVDSLQLLHPVQPPRLPLSDSPIRSTPSRVPPREIGILRGVLPDHLFVQLDTQSGGRQQLDRTVLDVKDFGVLEIGQEIKVTGIVVHLSSR